MVNSLALLLVLLLSAQTLDGARILGIIPTPSISHQLPFRLIALELAKRGHQVTVMTTDPIRKRIENYTEVDLSDSYQVIRSEIDMTAMYDWSLLENMKKWTEFSRKLCDCQLSSPEIKSFLQSRPSFDVVIMEKLMYQSYYGLIRHLGSPIQIGFVSFSTWSLVLDSYGNPINPAYCPEFQLEYTDHMSFWQRLYNTYAYLVVQYVLNFKTIPEQEAVLRAHFGPGHPPVYETERNFSLLLANNHFSMSYPAPRLPNVVELTGLHLQTQRTPLPEEIESFLEGAEHGVIYFSLGSNVMGSAMPEEKRLAFLKAFAQLPQRVLWKWETGSMADLPPNVMVSRWLPQQDVLAHRNVRLFITQGGLQSMNEAGYFAVPMIGIPFVGDQNNNVAKIVQAGIGYHLRYRDVTTISVLNAIRTVLEDNRYRENMQRFSAVFREHQSTSLERAVWWVEYVVRHHGAPHLRSAALDLSWWQLLLLDVVAFILVSATVVVYVTYRGLRYAASILRSFTKSCHEETHAKRHSDSTTLQDVRKKDN